MAVPPLSEVNRNLFNKLIDHHIRFSLAKVRIELTKHNWYRATALVVRDMLVEKMLATRLRFDRSNAKKLYYLSLEFLIGRSLENNLFNLGMIDTCRDFLAENGMTADPVRRRARRCPGNGGLGRLAACFLDSLATLDLPGTPTESTTSTDCSGRKFAVGTRSSGPTRGSARLRHGWWRVPSSRAGFQSMGESNIASTKRANIIRRGSIGVCWCRPIFR